jgi:hypothetical protein
MCTVLFYDADKDDTVTEGEHFEIYEARDGGLRDSPEWNASD